MAKASTLLLLAPVLQTSWASRVQVQVTSCARLSQDFRPQTLGSSFLSARRRCLGRTQRLGARSRSISIASLFTEGIHQEAFASTPPEAWSPGKGHEAHAGERGVIAI